MARFRQRKESSLLHISSTSGDERFWAGFDERGKLFQILLIQTAARDLISTVEERLFLQIPRLQTANIFELVLMNAEISFKYF